MPLINNFSLRLTHKIMAIAIVGLAGVILIGGMHMYADFEITRYREAAERARAIFELSSKIEIELLEARRAEKDFLLRNDRKKAESHDRISRTVAEAINTLRGKLQEIGRVDLAGKIEAMNDALKRYRAHFASAVEERVGLGLDEKSGLEGRLRDSVHDIETRVNELKNSDLLITMLMMRRHEKDFMLRRDAKYGDEMKKRAAEFSARVDGADIPESGRAEIRRKLSDYQRDFFAWFETALKLDVELKATSDSFSEIEPAIEAVSKAASEIRAEADRADARIRANIDWQMKFVIILIAFSVLGISALIGRSVSRPLSAMTAAIVELAAGNFALALPGLGRKDELGDMVQAVETFKIKSEEKARTAAEAKATQDQMAGQQRKADMHRLADDFEDTVGQIIETIASASSQLEASAGTLASTAERTQGLAGMVTEAHAQGLVSVQSVAMATEELSSSVNEIGRQVQESARIAGGAVDQARQTNDRVGELSKAAGRIGDVVELINTIAGQTNLLALNATIEAARAGEAGRGFAVVASEVKALAEQTAKATGEIGQQINGIQTATQESVAAIREISGTIERLSEISSAIAAAVEEQGAATQGIAGSVQQIAGGTEHVSSNIADVQSGATETGSASSQLLAAARSLSGDSNRLKLEVGKFLSSVRVA